MTKQGRRELIFRALRIISDVKQQGATALRDDKDSHDFMGQDIPFERKIWKNEYLKS